jgi:hypothetical protein
MADFATVAELELRTGMVGLGARGTAILGDVSAHIRGYCGQDIDAVTGRQEEFAGDLGRSILNLTQTPVTAVSAITENLVAFTEFDWSRWGNVWRTDWTTWDDGPILVTYDSGYATTEDEYLMVKTICIEVAARALGGLQDTFGLDIAETRGTPYVLSLSEEEKRMLDRFALVAVG